jgi:hypothetical protein
LPIIAINAMSANGMTATTSTMMAKRPMATWLLGPLPHTVKPAHRVRSGRIGPTMEECSG